MEVGSGSPSAALITRAEDFAGRAAVLRGRTRIAVDTEGDGMFRYRSSLCIVQICDGETVDLLDTLRMDDLSDLGAVLAGGPVKVVHDAPFDLRQLKTAGISLSPLLDTSVMGKFLGEPALGLGSLVEKYVGVTLDKSKQQEDWGARPLPDAHLQYLADDVLHLLPLADALWAKVEEAGIAEEVEEECRYVIFSAARSEPSEAKPLWQRIKGSDRIVESAQAVLRELCLEREQLAEKRNVPPYRIASNQALLDLATQPPRGADDYGRMKGVPKPAWVRDPLLRAVQRGVQARQLPAEEKKRDGAPPPREERDARRKRHGTITAWRSVEAKTRAVSDQAILPGHCLEDLLTRMPASLADLDGIPGLGACRVERYGAKLLELLR